MKKIFICSAYRGEVEKNVEKAKKACRYALSEGCAFFCPHLLYPQVLDDNIKKERELGIEIGKEFLKICDEIWIFGDKITEGMAEEINFAIEKNITVVKIKDIEIKENEEIEENMKNSNKIRRMK